jgi:hypothetical protein
MNWFKTLFVPKSAARFQKETAEEARRLAESYEHTARYYADLASVYRRIHTALDLGDPLQ